jgi:hypothetical protein
MFLPVITNHKQQQQHIKVLFDPGFHFQTTLRTLHTSITG